MVGDFIARAKLSKYRRVKLSTIVVDQGPRGPGDAKPTEDVFHHEPLHLLIGYCNQGLCFCSFSEVVYCDNDEFDLTLSYRKWSDYVDAPLSEWPMAKNWGLLLIQAINHARVPLTLIAPLDIVL